MRIGGENLALLDMSLEVLGEGNCGSLMAVQEEIR